MDAGIIIGQAVIGSGGGTVATSDGKVTLKILAGALSDNTNVTVSSTDTQGSVGDVYEFGPSGTSFTQPIEATISYDPAPLPADTTEDDLLLLTETEDGYLEALTDISIDKVNHRISGKTSHFSAIWIYSSKPVVDNSNLPLTSESIPSAMSFRMPIGDSRDLSNKAISCNDSQSQSSEDLGDNLKLLTISSYDNNYPKISFNASGTSNKWLAGTAFNRNDYLTNYDTGSLGLYDKKTGDFHPGEDWNRIDTQDGGRPIHAIADGIILFNQRQWRASGSKADQTFGFGNIVVIGHKLSDGRIIASVYGHMKDISPCLVGKRVNKGDIIGLIGTTGASTANHLHFEIIKIKKDIEKPSMDASTVTTATFGLNNGVTGTVTYTGTTATFTPSGNLAYSTTYTATITTGVKDSAGNAMASNYTWTFTTGTAPDTTPPTVSSTSPASSATNVAVSTAITATFSEAMDASTVTTATFGLDNGVTGTVIYSGTTATFTPSGNLAYSTTYTATITTGVKDSAGNAMASNYTWTFTTGAATAAPGANFKMPDTNQTTSYTTTFGEDHDYTINPPSYTDNANGTITDNVTGLIWQKQDDGVAKTWASAITYCDALVLGGQTDWRLPSRIELISIVDYGVYIPSINTTYFPGTISSAYWSSTTNAYGTSGAWGVDFYDGYAGNFLKSNSYYVRCVRGGQ